MFCFDRARKHGGGDRDSLSPDTYRLNVTPQCRQVLRLLQALEAADRSWPPAVVSSHTCTHTSSSLGWGLLFAPRRDHLCTPPALVRSAGSPTSPGAPGWQQEAYQEAECRTARVGKPRAAPHVCGSVRV